MRQKNILTLIICMAIVGVVAFIGSLFTSQSVNSAWYESIKPSITPPNYVFPIVWTVLFFLIGLSLYFAWTDSKKEMKKRIAIIFAINFGLNIIWSILYFGMQSVLSAFFEILLLIASIAYMMSALKKVSKTSGYLLIPYLLWVCFAAILTYLSLLKA